MTETTEVIKIKSRQSGKMQELVDLLQTQVQNLTEEKKELQFKFDQRGRIMNSMTADFKKLKAQLSNREKEIEALKENFDKTEFFYFVEDEEQLGSPDDVAEYWDCPIGGTLDIQSCKVFFQPTQTYIRTEKGMVPVQSKEGEEE